MSAATVVAAVAMAFDLVCSGTTTDSSVLETPHKETPFHRVYHIDLDNPRWCADECPAINPILSVTQQEIELLGGADDETVFNRETNRIVRFLGPGDAIIESGTCKTAPFTQFPKPKP